jgi:hypothetical protein
MAALALALTALVGTFHFVDDEGRAFELRAPVVDLTPELVVSAAASVRAVQLTQPDDFFEHRSSPRDRGMALETINAHDNLTTGIILIGGAALLTSIVLDWVHHK